MTSRQFRRLVEAEWKRARGHLGCCGVCAERIRHGEHITAGSMVFPGVGLVLTRMHTVCWRQVQRDPVVRDRVVDEGYRSLFDCGPDSVGGSA